MSQYTSTKAVTGLELFQDLLPKECLNLIPPETTRIVIDISVDRIVKVHYECNAQPELLQVVAAAIKHGEKIESKE